jgi:hypothetical protein
MTQGGADARRANVAITISTTLGEPINMAQVSLTSLGGGHQFKKSGESITFEGLPFDRYVIEAKAPGFTTQRETIGIYEEVVHYRMGLPLASREGSTSAEISGEVDVSGKTDLWLRLVPVYAGGLIQCQPDHYGRYRFVSPDPGKYVLLFFEGGKLLSSKELDFVGGKMTVDLDVLPK